MKYSNFFEGLLHIFFPKVCCGCEQALLLAENVLCLECLYHLPLTDFHIDRANDSAKQLWGKLDAQYVTSMLYLDKSSTVERLLHKLKFLGYSEIGEFLGARYASTLTDMYLEDPIDFIIPIPIHISKLKKRGYNQAECFAKGLSIAMDIPLVNNILIRTVASASQTTKSRLERYDNVADVFELKGDTTKLNGKHILLVDDVLTTGATLSSAGNVLTEAGIKVSIATIARA